MVITLDSGEIEKNIIKVKKKFNLKNESPGSCTHPDLWTLANIRESERLMLGQTTSATCLLESTFKE